MLQKTFNEMMAIDVSPWVKKRDGADYLPWAACKLLLHKNGAETVLFQPVPGADGSTLRKSDLAFTDKNGVQNRCYEVLVHITVDNMEWDTAYPVLNGANPVKDNSMSQQRVHNAVRRAFVKGVAERTGLGYKLWLDTDDMPEEENLARHSLAKCKQRLTELITEKIAQGIPLNVIADRLRMDEDTLRGKLSLYNELARLEKAIGGMQK